MRLTTLADADAAARRTAEVIARLLGRARAQRGVAHLSLAGGNTPRRVYELLVGLIDDWSAIELWFGDERCVEPQDEDSNYHMVAETLLAGGAVDEVNVHRIRGELGPQRAAAEYARELCEHVACDERGVPVLDVALLGLGEDAHTASLFPGRPALAAEGEVCVGVEDSPKPPPQRVTLTLDTLRAARLCLLLATGAGKADAVAAVIAGPDRHAPASLLREGRLELIVDDAASPQPVGR